MMKFLQSFLQSFLYGIGYAAGCMALGYRDGKDCGPR